MRRTSKLPSLESESGLTLVEMLVAMTLGVIVMGGVLILLIGAMRSQPRLEKQSTNIQTARFVLERLTREIRNGIVVDKATASSVSFQTLVRRTACGASTTSASAAAATRCEVTYTCSGSSCSRTESAPGIYTGTSVTIFSGLNNSASVFSYKPDSTSPTYIEVTLKVPDPKGTGSLTVSDGASMRNATLGY
ncbi:MAG TPA: prepilin-type N-terminal cleavage/methylation domain-containing protein [Solirubrobacterales bacterium]|nr:prepilin-type N-terminal cleavage/methylation domain-containing protein [Solirubrobacterales bacterium]